MTDALVSAIEIAGLIGSLNIYLLARGWAGDLRRLARSERAAAFGR